MKKILLQTVFAAVSFGLLSLSPARAASSEDEILVKYFDIARGKLVFTYSKDSKPQIWVLNFSTLVAGPLVAGPGGAWDGRFSPDGKKVVFVSDRTGNKEIFVAESDGSNVVQLTTDKANAETPDWSHDGKKIAYISNKGGAGTALVVMNADGSGATVVTKTTKQYSDPRWAPNGREIILATSEYWPGSDLLTVDLESKKITVLTSGYGSWTQPVWSPDGKSYAHVFGPAEDPDIWVRDMSSAKGKAFVTRAGKDLDPEWLDDKDLFFLGEVTPGSGHYEIFLSDAVKNQVIQITECPGNMRNLSWFADGPIQREAGAKAHSASIPAASPVETPVSEFGDKPAAPVEHKITNEMEKK